MYVMPFWSYRAIDDAIAITNHLTGRTQRFAANVIELIGSNCDGPQGEDVAIARLRDLHVLFEDRSSADRWIDGIETAAAREQPTVDQIELTNRCPYSCKMCPRTSSMSRSLGDMDSALFARIIEQIAERQDYVALHHFGESLLHKDLPNLVRLARQAGVATGLSCNPPSLKPALAARLLEAGIANLLLSFDSLDPSVYRSIRGGAADAERAVRHIDALVRMRDEGRHATTITVQLIHMHENSGEAMRFLDFCRDHGVDRGVVVRFGRWDFSDEKTNSLGQFTSPLYHGFCMRPQQSLVVLWDGRVVPCCHDYDGLVVLGDLREQTLDEIWANEAGVAFRRASAQTVLCRTCAFGRGFRESKQAEIALPEFHRDRHSDVRTLQYLSPDWAARVEPDSFEGFDLMD